MFPSCPTSSSASPIINILQYIYYNWLTNTDTLLLTKICSLHQSSHFRLCCSMGFDKCLMHVSPITGPQRVVLPSSKSRSPFIHFPPLNPLALAALLTLDISALSRLSPGWNQTGCSLFRLASVPQ